jgi:hypothetical protein
MVPKARGKNPAPAKNQVTYRFDCHDYFMEIIRDGETVVENLGRGTAKQRRAIELFVETLKVFNAVCPRTFVYKFSLSNAANTAAVQALIAEIDAAKNQPAAAENEPDAAETETAAENEPEQNQPAAENQPEQNQPQVMLGHNGQHIMMNGAMMGQSAGLQLLPAGIQQQMVQQNQAIGGPYQQQMPLQQQQMPLQQQQMPLQQQQMPLQQQQMPLQQQNMASPDQQMAYPPQNMALGQQQMALGYMAPAYNQMGPQYPYMGYPNQIMAAGYNNMVPGLQNFIGAAPQQVMVG